MRKRGKASFDPKIFLAKVGEGKTVSKYWKDQIESRVSFFMNKFRKLVSSKRLARLLLLLANFGKEGRPEPIVGKFSQETLAEMIGTTRQRKTGSS